MDDGWYTPWAPRPRVSPDALSLHQQDIAALIAEGLSDAEIARAVVGTREAVSALVEDILRQLGVESRVRIAAWATGAGLAVHRPDRDGVDRLAP